LAEPSPAATATPASAWSPFRHRQFAAMRGPSSSANVGSWMQTVAAQWLMLTLTSSATNVALVQTAAGLPVVLFAALAGTIGDLVDRRRFLLVTQALAPPPARARDQAGPGPARPAQGHDRPGPPGNRHALADTPAREAPAQEAPARKTPARKTPARKTPARKTPARKTPARKTPAREDVTGGVHPAATDRSSCQTRCGEAGMSMCRTPRCASASMIAFCTAGVAPMVPASPMPLAPSGL
jgi:hypothetical protein